MTLRRGRSRTADLFAVAKAPAMPAPTAVPGLPKPQGSRAPAIRQLWYAVLFPALGEADEAAAALPRLARQAQRFTSFVSIEAPDALLLEVKGSLRLFGSAQRLHADIDACWADLAVPARSAIAPTTLAALWCARAGARALIEDPALLAGSLARLPVACTAWDADRLQTLRSMGVASIGELLHLPRAGLARRFGPAAVLDLDIALGRSSAPRQGARSSSSPEAAHSRDEELIALYGDDLPANVGIPWPIDIRHIDQRPWDPAIGSGRHRLWMRADETLPDWGQRVSWHFGKAAQRDWMAARVSDFLMRT